MTTAADPPVRMKLGLFVADPGGAPDPIEGFVSTLEQAVADGFSSAWFSNIVTGIDTLTAIAVAGRQVPGIELGTGVVPIYPRHPASLAQQALTTQLAVGGRLTLGIGLSHAVVVEGMWGLSFDRPARAMREYLDVLQPLLTEGSVSFDGDTVKAHLALQTHRPHRTPVLLAALAPKMLKLAGERTDGTVLWMTGPRTVSTHVVPALSQAAERAGRPAPRVVCALPVCVTEDTAAAREGASKLFAIYGQLPSYRAMLDREGAAEPGDVAIVGDEDSVRAQIQGLAEAGVTDFVAAPFDTGTRTRDLLRSLATVGVA